MRWSFSRAGCVHVLGALGVGLALRALFVLHHPQFVGDTLIYGDLAQNLLRHGMYGLTEDHIRPTLIRLPGYPLFLALCFSVFGVGNYLPVLWVQVFVDLCGCALLTDLARRLFGRRVGLAALWLSALCPFTANYTAAALAETLSIFCVALSLWGLAFWHARLRAREPTAVPSVVISCALAGAALLRPDGGLLAAAVLPPMLWVAWHGRPGALRVGVRDAAIAAGLLCAVLGTWAARNWRVFHVVQPLAPKYANDPGEAAPLGFARWYRTWGIGFGDTVRVYWVWDGSEERMEDLPARAFDSAAQRQETADLYARYNRDTSTNPALEAGFAGLAEARVRAHPWRYYVGLPLARVMAMWLRPRTELTKLPLDWLRVRVHPGQSASAIGYAGLNFALLGLAAMGLWRWRWLGWRGGGVVAWAVGSFVLLRTAMLLTIDNAEPRYTLECFPAILLLASITFVAGSARLVE